MLNVARYDIDDLREALLAGDTARLVRTLDGLRQEGRSRPADPVGHGGGNPRPVWYQERHGTGTVRPMA